MFVIDDKDVKKYEMQLKTLRFKAFPFATKQTMNASAFSARSHSQQNLKKDFILRNKFSISSIRVKKTNTLKISQQEALTGTIAPFLATQEFGGTKAKKGKHGVPIPTSFSSNEGERTIPRKKLPTRPNKLSNINLKNKRSRGTRKQANLIKVKEAAQSSNKIVFLETDQMTGIYKITGGKRNPKPKLLYSLKEKSIKIPQNRWLLPSVERTKTEMPTIYKKALIFQLKRHQLF